MPEAFGHTYIGEEAFFWKDGDGNYYLIGTTETNVMSEWGGIDMPDPQLITERYPDRHGVKRRGLYYTPRTITLGVRLSPGSRTGVWDERAAWRRAMNPDRGTGSLVVVIPTAGPAGTYTRQIDCSLAAPWSANTEQQPNVNAQGMVLQLQADFPFFYDPTEKTSQIAFSGATSVNLVLANEGETFTYPTFVIYPPATYPLIQYGDDEWYLQKEIAAADGPVYAYMSTIDEEGPRVVDSYGVDHTSLVTRGSTWLAIPSGHHVLRVSATYGGTGRVDALWHNWFLGV